MLVLAAGFTACSNSPLAWKLLYGQFDTLMSREFLSFADFDAAQEFEIKLAVDDTVRWHRQQELPRYADAIRELQQRILTKPAQPQDLDWLFETLTSIGRRFEERSPLLQLIPVLAELDDRQIGQIAAHLDDEFEESRREREKEADQDPAEHSAKGLKKFFKRLGLNINPVQKERLIASLERRRMTQEARETIWRQWADKLLIVLNGRQSTGFVKRFEDHYFARLTLMESSAPEAWRHDQQLFKELLLDLFQSMDADQIESMQEGLDRVKNVALELAAG